MPAAVSTVDPTLRHRKVEAIVRVAEPGGRPLADTEVTVEQRRHAFAFGSIGFDFIPLANGESAVHPNDARVERFGAAEIALLEHLEPLWLDLFNTATLPFYWGRFEGERGKPDTERLRKTAQWFVDRGVTVKGHPLVWHTVTAPWLLDLPVDEIEQAQRHRIRREVADFAGLIDTWDAINEPVIMPVFRNGENGITRLARERGRIATIRMAFEEARSTNPAATLLINDFDLGSAYECLIEGVLEAGIQIDAIGLQTHMHKGYRGEEWVLDAVERFSRYGLPLHMTETSILSGHLVPPEITDLNDYQIPTWPTTPEGEERQADELVRHYRSLVAHPSVQAINYWGISDSGSWLGAPVGLVRADGSLKPSYEALHSLIKGDWWMAPTTLQTDHEGRARVSGFAGDYRLSAHGQQADFTLAGSGSAEVDVCLQ